MACWHHVAMRTRYPLAALALVATPVTAQLRPLVEPPASAAAARDRGVDVYLINEGATDAPATGPAEIETVARDGARLRLIAAPDGEPMVRPGGFARLHYRLAATMPAPAGAAVASVAGESVTVQSRGVADAVLSRFSPYEPIYGVFDAKDGGKLQVSFALRAIGAADGPHLSFAYTQNMLWRLDLPSAPIRPTTYSPEVFVEAPVGRTLVVGGGYAHDSNGQGPATSIDANRIFVRATKTLDLGGGWTLGVTPRVWFYVLNRGIAPDLPRYWGYTSLAAAIGRTDGLKVAGMIRGNPGTGKGSGEVFVSYPLTRLGLKGVYLFGQGFTGYGEMLDNYDRSDSHVRLGIALTR